MDKYTGKRLDGRYEIQELIGVGGMAMVYKAHDNLDDKTVAIKILKDEFLGNEEFIRRFKNESKAIAVLSHPNIVKVYDVSFGDRIQYIVMEYIDGITLKEYIGQQNAIPWKEAVHFTVQILQALQHAHEKGIVHRDVKPQNIMLLQDGTIKVTDFGIARINNGETRTITNKAIGSVHYIAPEQAKGGVTDGKADIYSVGVMLYEMLTGKLPFDADSAVSVAIMQLQNEPKPLRELNDSIPEGLEEITLRAMRKNPNQRYESAKEMLQAIETFRKNPATKFNYSYFVDGAPTKYVETIEKPAARMPAESYHDDYGIYEEEGSSTRSKTVVKWVTILASVLVLAAFIFFFVLIVQNIARQNEIETVDVPNFVGMNIEDIQNNKNYKFNFRIIDTNEGTTPNAVVAQDPEPGTKKIKENATIKLTVFTNKKKVEVPKVKNYMEEKAIEKLKDKGFDSYDVQKVYSSDVAAGYVIDCSPQEGTDQYPDTTLTLIVSLGAAPEQIEIPSVTGLSFDKAKANLEALGFKTEKAMIASALEPGTVIGTDPLPGNKLTKRKITIQVSDGSLIRKALDYSFWLPGDEYGEVSVKVIWNAPSGNKTLYDQVIIPAETVDDRNNLTIPIEPDGAVENEKGQKVKQLTVMVDGVKWETAIANFDLQSISRAKTDAQDNYRIKQPSFIEDKLAAFDELTDYADTIDYSVYDRRNAKLLKSQIDSIVDSYGKYDEKTKEYTGSIFEASSKAEIRDLLEQAKTEIDEMKYEYPTMDDTSSEPSQDESSDDTSSDNSEDNSDDQSDESSDDTSDDTSVYDPYGGDSSDGENFSENGE